MNTLPTPALLSIVVAGAALVSLAACSDKPKSTLSTNETRQTQSAVNAYDATGSKALKLQADQAFIELDKEIKELEARVATTTGATQSEAQSKLTELKKRHSELRGDFNEAKFNTLIKDIKESVR